MKLENFNERPHQSEKEEALNYIRTLMEQARRDSKLEDIPKLEKLLELVDSKRYGLVWEEHAEIVGEEMKTKIPVFIEDNSRKEFGTIVSRFYQKKQRIAVAFCMVAIVLVK